MKGETKVKLIQSIDIMNDKKKIIWLNIASVALVMLFYFLFTLLAGLLPSGKTVAEYPVTRLLVGSALLIVLIVIHELIHGVFFKLFSAEGKVKFGFKNGMAYATSPGSRYSKGKFAWITLAPFVLITLGLMAAYLGGLLFRGEFILLASAHAACCVGDFYWIYLLLRAPREILVEDTEVGINFYG